LGEIYFEDWGPGWTSLGLTVLFGVVLAVQTYALNRAQKSLQTRILVTGSRGKSGTVRLLHAMLVDNGITAYSKVTGTTAAELMPDGTEKPTVRHGAAGIPEMKSAMLRSKSVGATFGVFESMAITPKLIELVDRIVRPQIGVIPTIRLDHTEEEGSDELEIASNILYSVRRCRDVFTAVEQPEIIARYKEMSKEFGFKIHFVSPSIDQPKIPGQHKTNVALAIAISEHLGLSSKDWMKKTTLEPEANIFHRFDDGSQTIELYDISSANDPQSAKEAFESLVIDQDRLVIPVVVSRWERPQRGVIFSSVFTEYEPIVFKIGTQKRGNKDYGECPGNCTPLRLNNTISMRSLLKFINSKLEKNAGSNIALVLFENVHHPTADRLRKLFQTHAKTLEQVS